MKRNNEDRLYLGYEMLVVVAMLFMLTVFIGFTYWYQTARIDSLHQAMVTSLTTQAKLIARACE